MNEYYADDHVTLHLGDALEVLRSLPDGSVSCCEARRRGYLRVITYTRDEETGASVKASGFRFVARVPGREWTTPSRPRALRHDNPDRSRWERVA